MPLKAVYNEKTKRWDLVNKKTGKVEGHSKNKEDAQAAVRASYARENGEGKTASKKRYK